MNPPSARSRPGCAIVATALLAALLAGCATDARLAPSDADDDRAKARFYWPYAALAADVYRSRGEVDTRIAIALASPWLRAEVEEAGSADIKARFARLGNLDAERLYRDRIGTRCKAEALERSGPQADNAARLSCRAAEEATEEDRQALASAAEEPNNFVPVEPRDKTDCEYSKGKEPAVPVDSAIRDYGWSRVPELQKQTAARAWTLFVPDLAIDVWRRSRGLQDGAPLIEYAVVYRGTVGGGGWVSNLRGLTAMTPFVWDQYRQARQATEGIINQVYRLHTISDALFQREQPTRVLFTAVGHSLGAGLAKYIYLRMPQFTRVVGFDPSPIDGSATIAVPQRGTVMGGLRHPVDADPRDPAAAMHLLFEDGEFIAQVMPCQSGPIWGDEGGPRVRCERVNFSRGNTFRQHNMAQLACKLFLAREGKPVR